MSGGVDSSVAAALLKEQGYRVTGVTMKIWGGQEPPGTPASHGCYGPGERDDIDDAREVARILGIPFHVFDLTEEYRTEVLNYFCSEYLSGRTPNPCLKCNRTVKFGALLRRVEQSGIEFDYFATGHYAMVEHDKLSGCHILKKAHDLTKDQSYFIASLSQEQLARVMFPLGSLTKTDVRKLAAGFGLPVERKAESQDFFTGELSALLPASAPGPILDRAGRVLGEHRGISYFTIGQRRGLGLSSAKPLFVVDIETEINAIIVGRKEELYSAEFIASGMNWIAIDKPSKPIIVKARIRYRHHEAEALLSPMCGNTVSVHFKKPQMSITPGQAVVFYDGDVVLGAGTIERSCPHCHSD